MCRPRIERVAHALGAALTLAAALTGCSDLYFDRRDAIALSAGDAIAANEIAQMVDPWPPQSGNRNIAANGQKMQSAVERYRTNKVTQPVSSMTLDITNQQQPAPTAQTNTQAPAPSGNASTSTASTQVSTQ